MPELPEVSVVCSHLSQKIIGEQIQSVDVRQPRLRYPVNIDAASLHGYSILAVQRRGKYIIISLSPSRSFVVHLGMSGRLLYFPQETISTKHDHLDVIFKSGSLLRFHDPRRFGCFLCEDDWQALPLISHLGIEPLSTEFCGQWLFDRLRGKSVAIKTAIMDSSIVVGVGNIYASESLFDAGILPFKKASLLSKHDADCLVKSIKKILSLAIEAGGTTLRDFTDTQGFHGAFQNSVKVYQREGQPCFCCGKPIVMMRLSQRSTFYCQICQK